MKNRFQKILGEIPGDGVIVDKVLNRVYKIRSEIESARLVEHINKLIEEVEEKARNRDDK